jgi:hypothetical protein
MIEDEVADRADKCKRTRSRVRRERECERGLWNGTFGSGRGLAAPDAAAGAVQIQSRAEKVEQLVRNFISNCNFIKTLFYIGIDMQL